jgi:glycosyltransferase involved in cell wall biosynthesis
MRVAYLSFEFGEYCVRLASGIAHDQDTSVRLFLPVDEAAPYTYLLSKSVELQLFDKPRLRQPIKQIQMVTQLVKQIRRFTPDLVHLELGHLWFNWALPMLGDLPLVLTIHDALIHVGDEASAKTPQWIWDRACYHARERIVHAHQIKQLLVQRLQIPNSTVHVVPPVLMGDDTMGGDVQEEEALILFFGRIWEYKGLEYLIRAEPSITATIPQARILIAGTGQDFSGYRHMMVHPERFIVHYEYVSDEKRAEFFRRASLVVLPYIEASQSGVVRIAYRFGKPVVATKVGGLPELVHHGQTGYLVPARDANALANAIVLLLQNNELRKQFGENGKRMINAECAPELVGERTRGVYRLAINGNTSQRCSDGQYSAQA